MKGYRIVGERKAHLLNELAKVLNRLSAKGIKSNEVLKFLKIDARIVKKDSKSFLLCSATTKQLSGIISQLVVFEKGN